MSGENIKSYKNSAHIKDERGFKKANKNNVAKSENACDWRNLPPEERPAIGETVEVIRGKFKGYRGTVKGIVPKGIQIEVSQGSLQGTITVMRHLLKDADGKLMPER